MLELRLDLHTHLKIAKRTAFRPVDAHRAAAAIQRRGLHGLAITEHAHGKGFWDIYQFLLREHPYRHGRFEVDGARFYPGMEVTLEEHVDIAFIAPIDELRRLDDAFEHRLTDGYHPTAYELADRVDELELSAIRVAAHPVRTDKPADRLPPELLGHLAHAVEANGRFTSDQEVRSLEQLAAQIHTPIVGGSDAHVWPQIGAVATALSATSDRFADVRDAVLAGRCRPIFGDNIDRRIQIADRLKSRDKHRLPRLSRMPHLSASDSFTV